MRDPQAANRRKDRYPAHGWEEKGEEQSEEDTFAHQCGIEIGKLKIKLRTARDALRLVYGRLKAMQQHDGADVTRTMTYIANTLNQTATDPRQIECPTCGGSGECIVNKGNWIDHETCQRCHGHGSIMEHPE